MSYSIIDLQNRRVHIMDTSDVKQRGRRLDIFTFARNIFGVDVDVLYPYEARHDSREVIGWVSAHSTGLTLAVVQRHQQLVCETETNIRL